MGFRNGAYAKVWTVEPVSDRNTKLRISVSRKNKQTDKYEQEFSGFVAAIGTAAAKKAACLKPGARIKLGDTDVTTNYNKEKNIEYVNYKIFSFDVEDDGAERSHESEHTSEPQPAVGDGEVDDSRLPF